LLTQGVEVPCVLCSPRQETPVIAFTDANMYATSMPACVIVAVRCLSKALKDAHGNLHVRAARSYERLHLGKWNTHSKCMCQCAYTCCTVFVYCDYTMYSTVRCSYKCSLWNTFQVLYASIVICSTDPYYTNRHQGWSKLHTAFTKLLQQITEEF